MAADAILTVVKLAGSIAVVFSAKRHRMELPAKANIAKAVGSTIFERDTFTSCCPRFKTGCVPPTYLTFAGFFGGFFTTALARGKALRSGGLGKFFFSSSRLR